MNPFDVVKSIQLKKPANSEIDSLLRIGENKKLAERNYNGFIVNRAFSQFPNTVLLANESNQMGHVSPTMQFQFLYHAVPQGKKFSKWAKATAVDDEILSLIKEFYKYSDKKAIEVLELLSADDLENMKKILFKGGRE